MKENKEFKSKNSHIDTCTRNWNKKNLLKAYFVNLNNIWLIKKDKLNIIK